MTIHSRAPRALIAVSALVLAACASAPEETAAPGSKRAATYHVLMAEIALQRGEYEVAAREYSEAAAGSDSVETARQATLVALEHGFDAAALASARRWSELAADPVEAQTYVGRLELRAGRVEEAVEAFVAVLAARDLPAGYATLEPLLLSAGESDTALAVARELAARHPGALPAVLALARTALRAGEEEAAVAAAERALALAPDSPEAGLLHAEALLASGDREAAIATARAAAGESQDSEVVREYALLLAAADETAAALTAVNELLQREPDNPDALRTLALINFRAGNLDVAWSDFGELVGLEEHHAEALYYLARIAEREERYWQAIRLYTQVGEGPYLLAAQQRVSIILTGLGQPEAALEHLEGFAERNPRYALDLLLPQAQILSRLERYDEAIAIYDRLLGLRPRSEPLLLSRAETKLRKGALEAALADYREAVRLRPESAAALNALGYTLADRTERYDEARELIEDALSRDPDNPAIIDSMGWVLFRLGDYEGAREHLELAWAELKNPEIAAHLGETLWRLGERGEAREILREAYERFPGSEPLRDTIERLMQGADDVQS